MLLEGRAQGVLAIALGECRVACLDPPAGGAPLRRRSHEPDDVRLCRGRARRGCGDRQLGAGATRHGADGGCSAGRPALGARRPWPHTNRVCDRHAPSCERSRRLAVVASANRHERVRVGPAKGCEQPQEARRRIRRRTDGLRDPGARVFDDPDHSVDERREIIIGYSRRPRLLVVGFTERRGRVRIFAG